MAEYRLLKLIGNGATSDVFRAERIDSDGPPREVAIKRFPAPLSDDSLRAKMLRRELRLQAELCHPNIVSVYDCDQDAEGRTFLVLELVDGIDLLRLVRTLLPPIPVAVRITRDVLEALDHAHGKGIIHRDIAPHNVLLSTAGEVKVADFGLAKRLLSEHISPPGLNGHLGYIAPEIAHRREYDHRTDLYSVGAMLYELLTGRLPFDGDTIPRVIFNQTATNPIPPRQLRPNIPGPLDAITLQLLAPKPDHRPQSARAVIDALADLPTSDAEPLADLVRVCRMDVRVPTEAAPSHVPPPGALNGSRFTRKPQRGRLAIAIAAAVVMGAVGAVAATRAVAPDPAEREPILLVANPAPTIPASPESADTSRPTGEDAVVQLPPPDTQIDEPRQLNADLDAHPAERATHRPARVTQQPRRPKPAQPSPNPASRIEDSSAWQAQQQKARELALEVHRGTVQWRGYAKGGGIRYRRARWQGNALLLDVRTEAPFVAAAAHLGQAAGRFSDEDARGWVQVSFENTKDEASMQKGQRRPALQIVFVATDGGLLVIDVERP